MNAATVSDSVEAPVSSRAIRIRPPSLPYAIRRILAQAAVSITNRVLGMGGGDGDGAS